MIDRVLARMKASSRLQTFAAGARTIRWTFRVRREKGGLPVALAGLPGLVLREARSFSRRHAYYSDQDARDLDERYGIETRAYVDMNDVSIDASGAPPERIFQSTLYVGSTIALLRRALAGLAIDHGAFTFVDIGSGKGRVLAIASEHPFKKVVGVEFVLEMHRIAEENIAKIVARCPERRGMFELHCADAVAWSAGSLPAGDLVVYFFSPFMPEVMEQVLAGIDDQIARAPRRLYVMFTGNRQSLRTLAERPTLTRLNEERQPNGESLFIFAGGTARPATP